MRLSMNRFANLLLVAALPVWTACGDGNGNGTEPSPSIEISAAPGVVTIAQGDDGTVTVTLTRSGGFEGSVAVSASGLPEGVVATSPTIASGETQADLTFSAAPDASVGTETVTIQATGTGVTTATAEVSVEVTETATPAFSLALDPASVSMDQGGTASTTVQIGRTGGFEGAVDLAVSGAPAGLTATLGSASVEGDETSLDLEAAADLTPDTYTLTLTGSGEGVDDVTAELDVTVNESDGGTGVQASWTFCTDVPDWFAVRDGTSGDWMQIQATGGNTFEFEVDSDAAGVAYVQDGAFGSDLTVHLVGADEVPTIGQSLCAEAGDRTVDVTVQDLGADEVASLVLGSSVATIFGAAGNTGTFEQVPEGTLDLFGARAEVDQGTGAQMVNRLYLQRGLDPADGSSVTVDFAGTNSFDPQTATATIQNLDGDLASLSLGYLTPNMSSFLGLATFGELSDSDTRTMPLVPEAQQEADDLHSLFLTAVPDVQDPDRFRLVISFFAGTEDQELTLGPPLTMPTITTEATTPYARPRVQVSTQMEYDRYWLTTFDQDMASISLFVTDAYHGGGDLDVTLPDFSSAAGWDNAWGLEVGADTDVSFSAFGWDGAAGGLAPDELTDGMRILAGSWNGEFVP